VPQVPQLLRSLWVFVHASIGPHRVWPALHAGTHIPLTQVRSDVQATVHEPQCVLSLRMSVHTGPHDTLGGAHPPSTIASVVHTPATQPSFIAHAVPHAPQFKGS
jgi:hypothetical protein